MVNVVGEPRLPRMATPSSDEIAKLVGEIRELKNSLDDTSIDRAEIAKRYVDATNGLLTTKGEFDSAAWALLSADDSHRYPRPP